MVKTVKSYKKNKKQKTKTQKTNKITEQSKTWSTDCRHTQQTLHNNMHSIALRLTLPIGQRDY